MTKQTKDKLAARIAENRRGTPLSAEQDAELLAAYLEQPKPGWRKPSYRSLACRFGYGTATVMRAIKRASEAT